MASLYDLSIGACDRALGQLEHIVGIGQGYSAERKLDEANVTSLRVFPDMLPFTSQVQIACDVAKGAAARLAEVEAPKFDDTERSFDELKARIAATRAFLQSVPRTPVDAAESRTIVLKMRAGELSLTGLAYVQGFVLPNVYFHCATAYNLLRGIGAPLGKRDFLGAL
jgi:hypothetical protein